MSSYTYTLCDSFNLILIYWPLNMRYHDLFRVALQYLYSCPQNVTDDHGRMVCGGAEFFSHEISEITLKEKATLNNSASTMEDLLK